MKNLFVIVSLSLLLTSCGSERTCGDLAQHIQGTITKLSGPDTLEIGKTIPILVEVQAADSLCVTGVDATVIRADKDYVQIGANLLYSGAKKQSCDCSEEQKLYTIVYFTPNAGGMYIFGTDSLPSVLNAPNDSTIYRPTVR